jgi:molecular chaperone DnaJ
VAAQREWFEKDYYAVLGVPATASAKDITQAYRKLARQWHPDANPDDSRAEEKFKELSAAYDVLGDETRRKDYDEVRALGPTGARMGGPGGGFTGNVRVEDLGDLGDVFGGLFGGGRARRGGPRSGPPRGADLQTDLTLSFRAPPVTARGQNRARRRWRVRCAPAAGWSTTTRASSR